MDYQKALEYLEHIEKLGIRLGLRNTGTIINHLPFHGEKVRKKIRIIQVAGTNGKGSTARFLAAILRAAGFRTGLFTSPHLHDVRERIIIDDEWISESRFADAVSGIEAIARSLVEKQQIEGMPTFFEHTFLAALAHFLEERVDIAILEVGLGGRLDATSAITPHVSVITGISHDHTHMLGPRIRDIAREKAGIIKPGIPVVCGCSVHSIANSVIKNRARELNAPFHNVFNRCNLLDTTERDNGYRCRYSTPSGAWTYDVNVNGRHQTRNAAVAVKTAQVLDSQGLSIPDTAVRDGISTVRVPGRIEVMDTAPPVILDGGHNLESTRALVDFLKEKKKQGLTLIYGVLRDKNFRPMVRLLLPYIHRVILSEPRSARALPAGKLLPLFTRQDSRHIRIINGLPQALAAARRRRREILVTGSFYLAGEMRHIITQGG